MNTTPANKNQVVTILLVVLIGLLILFALNVLFWFFMMGGGMMSQMLGTNSQYTPEMMAACADMMKNNLQR
ncbi:MAG: hypothetical protein JNM46_00075 [Anaerolineales bacterium]|nr:hypothetical protein [Anaerolineales bacterium]